MLVFVIISSVLVGFFNALSGTLKAKYELAKEKKYIKNINPYIYYRELPNNYGIGVNTLLYDSTIENYKDIVAVILDLCARKYLNLVKQDEKYIIQILKRETSEFLKNEKYVWNHVITNSIREMNYHDWYMCCLQDGIDLGLFNQRKVYINNESIDVEKEKDKLLKSQIKICAIISILFMLCGISSDGIFISFFYSLIIFMFAFAFVISQMIVSPILGAKIMKQKNKEMRDLHYKVEIENDLKKTKKGIEEVHKLYSLRAFLSDFGKFVDKNPEEIVLWDRYLSFAQVFGLTKEMMSTGYEQLVNNASFTIDSIENITLSNIEVK